MKNERRDSQRIVKELSATAERVGPARHYGGSHYVAVTIVNVSGAGVGFVSPESFDRDELIRIIASMNNDDAKVATGRIFVTTAAIRHCEPEKGTSARLSASHIIGAQLKEQTAREHEAWQSLIHRWSPSVR